MSPVFRKLRTAEYGVDHSVIQQVLKNLHAIGLLEDGKRNSYKLSEGLKLNDMHEEKTQ